MVSTRLFTGIVLVSLILVYLIFDPALYSFFPRCPVYSYLGFYCPGCGSQRALHKLLTGKVAEAAGLNLLVVLYLPLIVVYYLSSIPKCERFHYPVVRLINNKWFIHTTLFIIILFCVIRNINSHTGRYLAP